MIETKYFIYPQTEKTGSTYFAHVLNSLFGANWHPKHQRIPNNFSIGQRKVLATIRNPWAWYVSAFSFGCAQKGGIYQRIMKQPHLREHHWKEDFVAGFKSFFFTLSKYSELRSLETLYENPNDIYNFRQWLTIILDPTNAGLLPSRYGSSHMPHTGLRVLHIFIFSIIHG